MWGPFRPLLNGDEVTIDNNQKLTRNSNGYIVIKA